MFLNGLCQIYIDTVRQKCGREHTASGVHVAEGSGGYMDQVHFAVQHFRKFNGILYAVASFHEFIT